MTTYGNTVLQSNENIPTNVRATSIMRGKDRKIVKSETNARRLGLWNFGVKTIGVNPVTLVPPLTEIDDIKNYYHSIYTAQNNYHLEIDTKVFEIPITEIHTPPVPFLTDYASPISLRLLNDRLMPPNKNIYIVQVKPTPEPGVTYGSGDANHAFGISTGINSPTKNISFVEFFKQNDFQFANEVAWTDKPDNEIAAIYRSNSLGNLPTINTRFPITTFPFTGREYFREQLSFQIGWVYEFYQINDRYDCNEPNYHFRQRKYQAFTDNEWDTKVATDA